MNLYDFLMRSDENLEKDFRELYENAVKSVPYSTFKDAVLSNIKKNLSEEKIAA